MSTTIRPETSKKNEFYISKHRYYELKHFCLQYPEWKEKIRELEASIHGSSPRLDDAGYDSLEFSDSTGNQASNIARLKMYCSLVEDAARNCDSELGKYIFNAVTKDISFCTLKTKYGIPCEKEMYYKRYRKFFWLLSWRR